MSFRFHPRRTFFEHDLPAAPPICEEEAAELVCRGDNVSQNELVSRHAWLAIDIAGRALHKLNLPSHLGEELASQGLIGLGEAVPHLSKKTRSIRAYLSKAIENQIAEFLEEDSLCAVPARTRRDRKAKGKRRVRAPKIGLASEFTKILPSDDDGTAGGEETVDETLSRLAKKEKPCELQTPEDLYLYCRDQFDMDILDLRYDDGAGPRCCDEVAQIIGLDRNEVEYRLDAIETRLYRDRGGRKPTMRRSPGKRVFQDRAETCPT